MLLIRTLRPDVHEGDDPAVHRYRATGTPTGKRACRRSSQGQTRTIRRAEREHPGYVRLPQDMRQ